MIDDLNLHWDATAPDPAMIMGTGEGSYREREVDITEYCNYITSLGWTNEQLREGQGVDAVFRF